MSVVWVEVCPELTMRSQITAHHCSSHTRSELVISPGTANHWVNVEMTSCSVGWSFSLYEFILTTSLWIGDSLTGSLISIQPSSHPFSTVYPGLGHGRSMLSNITQMLLSLATSSSSTKAWGHLIPPFYSGSALWSLPSWMYLEYFSKEMSRRRPDQMPESSQWFYSKLLLMSKLPTLSLRMTSDTLQRNLVLAAVLHDLLLSVISQSSWPEVTERRWTGKLRVLPSESALSSPRYLDICIIADAPPILRPISPTLIHKQDLAILESLHFGQISGQKVLKSKNGKLILPFLKMLDGLVDMKLWLSWG